MCRAFGYQTIGGARPPDTQQWLADGVGWGSRHSALGSETSMTAAAASPSREELVYTAQLSEKAHRYDGKTHLPLPSRLPFLPARGFARLFRGLRACSSRPRRRRVLWSPSYVLPSRCCSRRAGFVLLRFCSGMLQCSRPNWWIAWPALWLEFPFPSFS